MKDIARTWSRMEAWLSSNAPEVLASLQPGATGEAIAEAEAVMGIQFPEVVRQSYRIHDGQLSEGPWLADGRELLSLDRLLDEWRVWKDLLDGGDFDGMTSEPDDFIRNDWWNPAWIPLTYDGAGNHDCLDLAPSAIGSAGQMIDFYHDSAERTRLAGSFDEWMATLAADMETDQLMLSEEYNAIMRKTDI